MTLAVMNEIPWKTALRDRLKRLARDKYGSYAEVEKATGISVSRLYRFTSTMTLGTESLKRLADYFDEIDRAAKQPQGHAVGMGIERLAIGFANLDASETTPRSAAEGPSPYPQTLTHCKGCSKGYPFTIAGQRVWFCPFCGTCNGQICPEGACGWINELDNLFCGRCGTGLGKSSSKGKKK